MDFHVDEVRDILSEWRSLNYVKFEFRWNCFSFFFPLLKCFSSLKMFLASMTHICCKSFYADFLEKFAIQTNNWNESFYVFFHFVVNKPFFFLFFIFQHCFPSAHFILWFFFIPSLLPLFSIFFSLLVVTPFANNYLKPFKLLLLEVPSIVEVKYNSINLKLRSRWHGILHEGVTIIRIISRKRTLNPPGRKHFRKIFVERKKKQQQQQ